MKQHIPVLVDEILQAFTPKPGDSLLDGTIGHGGHAKAYLEAAADTHVVGIDADPHAILVAKEELAPYKSRVQLLTGTFAQLKQLVGDKQFTHILIDLGIGSHQLADTDRGFSFQGKGLSMRYGGGEGLPSSDLAGVAWLEKQLGHPPDVSELIVKLPQNDLADLIRTYGEERFSYRIARAIKKVAATVTDSAELAEVITAAVPRSYEGGRIHPATRTFQALRLAVNREIESLRVALPQAVQVLVPGGLLAVISFHSLEDRVVKHFLRHNNELSLVTKKPIQASERERAKNPRSRSAKLRIAKLTNNN